MTSIFENATEPKQNRLFFAVAGLPYGIIMTFWALFGMGMGHGNPILFLIFSSPLTFLLFFFQDSSVTWILFSLTALFWTILCLLMSLIDYTMVRSIFVFLITAHYLNITAAFVAAYYTKKEDSSYNWSYTLDSIDGFSTFVIGLTIYTISQIVMWRRFKRFRKNRTDN